VVSAHNILKCTAARSMEYDYTVWFWGDAIAFDGLVESTELLMHNQSRDFCLRYFRRWAKRNLGWVDHLTPGWALLRLYQMTNDSALLEAAKRLALWLLEEVPRNAKGAPLYRPDLPPYRFNVWVDSIYHVPPFLALLAQITGEERYYDEAVNSWTMHVATLMSQHGPFLAHSMDIGGRVLRGYGWGRGNGWALFGMVDTLELLPKDHLGYPAALENFQTLACEILKKQDTSGFWRTLLHDREAYLESSTATFFGGTFTKGVRLGLLSDEYAQAANRAWTAALSRIEADGSFWGVSACTYAGTAPEDDVVMYKTLLTEVNVWGQGSAMRFAAERIRSGLA
jgi:unsaturated rhamnogalacturonyl hydrolase